MTRANPRLGTIVAATSLACCVATGVVWALSHTRSLPPRPVPGAPGLTITLGDGEVDVYAETHDGIRHAFPHDAGGSRSGTGFVGVDVYITEGLVDGWPPAPGAALRYFHVRRYRIYPAYFVVLFGIPLVWWLVRHPARRTARRRTMGVCPNCGYDPHGTSGRCPECGLYSPRAKPSDAAEAASPATQAPPAEGK